MKRRYMVLIVVIIFALAIVWLMRPNDEGLPLKPKPVPAIENQPASVLETLPREGTNALPSADGEFTDDAVQAPPSKTDLTVVTDPRGQAQPVIRREYREAPEDLPSGASHDINGPGPGATGTAEALPADGPGGIADPGPAQQYPGPGEAPVGWLENMDAVPIAPPQDASVPGLPPEVSDSGVPFAAPEIGDTGRPGLPPEASDPEPGDGPG